MAINVTDNINYKGPKPDFVRQQYGTKALMKSQLDSAMPDIYLAYCLEDHKMYLYDKTNAVDETIGKFREFNPGTAVGTLPTASEAFLNSILQYTGPSGVYTNGFFYKCVLEDDAYKWTPVRIQGTEDVESITNEEIDELIN